MSEKQKFEKFRELLRKGIGGRTQKEFAEQCGVSKDHLSRLIREPYIARPTKDTLRKLAAHMDNVTLAELLESCGYLDEAAVLTKKESELTEAQKRMKLPDWERCMLHVKDLKEGFSSFASAGQPVGQNLSEVFDYVHMLYTAEKTTFSIRKSGVLGGVSYSVIEAKATLRNYVAKVVFVAYYSAHKGTKEPVLDRVSFSGKDVLDAEGLAEQEQSEFTKYGIRINALNEVILFSHSADSVQGRLLTAIFGEEEGNQTIEALASGFGFYLKDVPPNFWQFLSAHHETFCKTEEETALYESAMAMQGDPVERFKEYERDEYFACDSGYIAVIAQVMCRETGIPFTACEDTNGEFEENTPCLMCDDEYVGGVKPDHPTEDNTLSPAYDSKGRIRYDSLVETVYRYAKELGVPYIQQCYFKYRQYIDDSRIKVE